MMNVQESIILQDERDEAVERYFNSVSNFKSTNKNRKMIIVVDSDRDLFFNVRKMLKQHKKEFGVIHVSSIEECERVINKYDGQIKSILFEYERDMDLKKHIEQTSSIKVPVVMIMRGIKNAFSPLEEIPELERVLTAT